jgi:hypothetical protein
VADGTRLSLRIVSAQATVGTIQVWDDEEAEPMFIEMLKVWLWSDRQPLLTAYSAWTSVEVIVIWENENDTA